MRTTPPYHAVLLLLASLLGAGAAAAQEATEPLLMPGKQSLYQRVLAAPGALLQPAPGARTAGEPVTPFTAFYVYASKGEGENAWLQVGTGRHGDVVGWLPAGRTLEWNQGLTVVFRDPVGHDRALLFRDKEALKTMATERQLERYSQLYLEAVSDTLPDGSPVVAIQPANHIDINEDFYLVPIRAHEDLYVGNELARLLRVSSVPLEAVADGAAPTPASVQAAAPASAAAAAVPAQATPSQTGPDGYTAGLVFVIDATLSMDPYIERTREAVMKIYDRLGDAGLLGNVNFGLVAFRDNLEAAPGLEYLARTYVDLEQGRNPTTFLNNVNELSATQVSSRDFREDAYAGVKQALDDMDWSGHNARYVVLITDAGARDAGDPL
ncbi:MAG: VWA domain-containing protein, partial [Gammaproteobacteria bacterium]